MPVSEMKRARKASVAGPSGIDRLEVPFAFVSHRSAAPVSRLAGTTESQPDQAGPTGNSSRRIDNLPLTSSFITTPTFERRLCLLPASSTQSPVVANRSACFRIVITQPSEPADLEGGLHTTDSLRPRLAVPRKLAPGRNVGIPWWPCNAVALRRVLAWR